ncbi:MAG: sulfite exporter TauE/SafE family protein [Desulfobulbaceae bacterium]|nr:sulfite exporter TauE/SafE family protein [Desulfobulbaceae bacterium]
MSIFLIIGTLGLLTGFLSGLLGIGGGIIMAPLLLYVPPLLGFEPLPMQTVAGLTIVQGLTACISGGLTHRKFHFLSSTLVGWMGVTLFITSFIGGMSAGYADNRQLLLVFAVMALIAALLIVLPKKKEVEYPEAAGLSFSRRRAVLVSTIVGFFGGLVGQGGSFILIPLMTTYVKVPTRIAIGSNLAIVFLSTLAAFLGKALTGQIVWMLTVPIVATVVPAAFLGANLSKRIPVDTLRIILGICIALAACRVGFSALGLA